jgi:hypothetical protein
MANQKVELYIAAPATYDDVVTQFINYLSASPCDHANLMTLFGSNPQVGITSDGPVYIGTQQVSGLFTAVARTFPRFGFDQTSRYVSILEPVATSETTAIVVAGRLKASHTGHPWNPGFDSSPGNNRPITNKSFRSLAACCIFTLPVPSPIRLKAAIFDSLSRYLFRQIPNA